MASILATKRGGLRGEALRQYLKEQAPIWTIETTSVISEALEKMLNHRISALIVTDKAAKPQRALAGIVTDRDLLKFVRRTANARFPLNTTPVTEIMTLAENVVALTPNDTRQKAIEIMKARNIRHLPVLETNYTDHVEDSHSEPSRRLVGVVSVSDLLHTSPRQQYTDRYGASLHPEGLLFVAPHKQYPPERQRVITKWTR
eukprot:CAMPEP_0197315072 /NCGR_PEP_ID=MMETSP0891-20130614/36589_1 /TAXON_ID=44058 ORGANISM="Aureoumbra lagunensis, Strain CCMP1510" /NCGR_SAMPLE_ID=MMETSP0891 /ASSEMBLY_ACC=CAM_ASM_000534 /LENGTH=201 /DNA_ID=CAMNT_0042803839 /DNA_START=59 /DNA_END=664 /DNA_ORIENTATION=-